jgi:predicted ATPase
MREGLADYQATGAGVGLTYWLCTLAEAYIWAGHFNDAANVLEEALNTADKTEERHYDAEIHRIKGELLLKRDPSNTKEASVSFERAIVVARNQSAKSRELRTTMSLTRQLNQQAVATKRENARRYP